MIDFNKQPILKSKEEAEFDDLCEKYYEMFGENYGFIIGSDFPRTLQEAIDEMKKCIETGKKRSLPKIKGINGY